MSSHVIDSFSGAYAFLSNFYRSPLPLGNGVVAPTLEHAFQAHKATCDEDFTAIVTEPTPGAAKRLGRQVSLRANWETVKIPVMRSLLAAKFADDVLLAEYLLATGDALLVEGNTWGDTFWGVAGGSGQNWLGHLLMARRAEVRASRVAKGAVA